MLLDGEKKRLQRAVSERIYKITTNQNIRTQLYRDLYAALKVHFNVPSYKNISSDNLQKALRFIENWKGGRN